MKALITICLMVVSAIAGATTFNDQYPPQPADAANALRSSELEGIYQGRSDIAYANSGLPCTVEFKQSAGELIASLNAYPGVTPVTALDVSPRIPVQEAVGRINACPGKWDCNYEITQPVLGLASEEDQASLALLFDNQGRRCLDVYVSAWSIWPEIGFVPSHSSCVINLNDRTKPCGLVEYP